VYYYPLSVHLCQPLYLGDIHGQYSDMLRMFEYGGFPPEANYLFLGNYIDLGKQSIETICLLLAYKIKYPENFFLLRGNHECASINRIHGFYDECKSTLPIMVYSSMLIVSWIPSQVNVDITSGCGRLLLTVSTACLLPPSLMRKYSAVMEVRSVANCTPGTGSLPTFRGGVANHWTGLDWNPKICFALIAYLRAEELVMQAILPLGCWS